VPRDVELTDDGHYVVIDGRRWRATDPAIPEDVAESLRALLMEGRRGVAEAHRSGNSDAMRAARDKVQRAKVALGERGTPWWEQSMAEREARWSL
jgi:hypothetical protein